MGIEVVVDSALDFAALEVVECIAVAVVVDFDSKDFGFVVVEVVGSSLGLDCSFGVQGRIEVVEVDSSLVEVDTVVLDFESDSSLVEVVGSSLDWDFE